MKKHVKTKKIFIDNIWIIGYYKNKEIIGRTKEIDGIHFVYVVNDEGKFQILNFNDIENISKLNVINKKINQTEVATTDIVFLNTEKLAKKHINYQNKYN